MQKKVLSSLDEIKAFSDPYRMRILGCYHRLDRPATIKEIADKLGEVPSKVHYHVKKLEKAGIMQLVYTKEINGIIAKYYEPAAAEFHIKHNEETGQLNEVYLNETHKLIAEVYDESKRQFLEQLDVKHRSKGVLSGQTVYLTEEEEKDFIDYISSFLENKSKPDRQPEGLRKYFVFASIIQEKIKKEGDSPDGIDMSLS